MKFNSPYLKKPQHEDAAYEVFYDLAYFCLTTGVSPEYVLHMTEKERAAWISAWNDIQKERNKG